MTAVVVAVALLVLAASFGSWFISQWLGARQRTPSTMIAVGGAGIVLLIGAAAVAIIVWPAWWQSLLPKAEFFVDRADDRQVAPARQEASSDLQPSDAVPEDSQQLALLLRATQEALRKTDWTAALAHLAQADSIGPRTEHEDFLIARLLAYVYVQIRNYRDAAAALDRQLLWSGMKPDERSRLLRMAAQLNFQTKNYERAIACAREYLEQQPGDVDLRVLVARASIRARRFTDDEIDADAQIDAAIDAAIDASLAAGREVPPSLLEMRSSSAQPSSEDPFAYAWQVQQEFLRSYSQHAEATVLQSVPAEQGVAASPPYGSGVARFDPFLEDWTATQCVQSSRSADRGRWSLDNECHDVVAIVFAWCRQASSACAANAANSNDWRYEPAGILMTTLGQRPSPQRLTKGGPLIAPIYVLKEVGDVPRIQFIACQVTDTEVLALLNEPPDFASDADRDAAFDTALQADKCYARVARLSRAGRRTGQSPDALLRQGPQS